MGHDYGRIDVFAEEHEDGRKELGATIVKEKKNYVIYKVKFLMLFPKVIWKVIFWFSSQKSPSSIRHRDSNSQPSDYEPLPLTTRPVFPLSRPSAATPKKSFS